MIYRWFHLTLLSFLDNPLPSVSPRPSPPSHHTNWTLWQTLETWYGSRRANNENGELKIGIQLMKKIHFFVGVLNTYSPPLQEAKSNL